jgi:AcrR family transcriptional regulator
MRDVGVRRMTLEGIAAAAGVSKATIYRWWSSKGTLALDAFQSAFVALEIPPPDTGSLRTDLHALFTMVLGSFEHDYRDRMLREIVAEAQSDTPLAQAIFTTFIEPYRAFHRPIFEAAIARGELSRNVDMPLVLDTLYGAYYHRLLLHHGDLSPAFFASVVDLLVDGLPVGSRGKALEGDYTERKASVGARRAARSAG